MWCLEIAQNKDLLLSLLKIEGSFLLAVVLVNFIKLTPMYVKGMKI